MAYEVKLMLRTLVTLGSLASLVGVDVGTWEPRVLGTGNVERTQKDSGSKSGNPPATQLWVRAVNLCEGENRILTHYFL